MYANEDGSCPTPPPGYDGKVCDFHPDNPPGAEEDAYYYFDDYLYDDDRTNEYFWQHEFITSQCHLDVLDGQECQIFHGSISLNKASDIAYQPAALNKVLQHLVRITGYLYLYQTTLPSLSFLRNVESIRECHDNTPRPDGALELPVPKCNPYHFANGLKHAIFIDENYGLTNLGLNRLRRVGGAEVGESEDPDADMSAPIYIKNNLVLCFVDTIDWSAITGGLALPTGPVDGNCGSQYVLSIPCNLGFSEAYMTSNRVFLALQGTSDSVQAHYKTGAVAPQCTYQPCADVCGSGGCWDGGDSSCQLCREPGTVLRDGLCVVGDCEQGSPSPGWYPDPTESTLCRRCHASCDDCSGGRADECTKCVGALYRLQDMTCGTKCPRGQCDRFMSPSSFAPSFFGIR
jgi:hypothetical protein